MPVITEHGAKVLPSVEVDSYNLEIRDEDGFVGDRASGRAFRAILDDWRDRLAQNGEDPLGAKATEDLSKNELDKKATELILSQQLFGRSYVVPPDTNPEAVAILREAFSKTMQDKDFLADADRLRISITPSSGAKLQEVVQRVHASDKAIIDRAKKLIEP